MTRCPGVEKVAFVKYKLEHFTALWKEQMGAFYLHLAQNPKLKFCMSSPMWFGCCTGGNCGLCILTHNMYSHILCSMGEKRIQWDLSHIGWLEKVRCMNLGLPLQGSNSNDITICAELNKAFQREECVKEVEKGRLHNKPSRSGVWLWNILNEYVKWHSKMMLDLFLYTPPCTYHAFHGAKCTLNDQRCVMG